MSVVIISTGGTIASTEDNGDDASPELTGNDLVAALPQLKDVESIETHDFSTIPSPHFTIKQMYDLVTVIREYNADGDTEGIVVTQGTDILEESSYFVDLCYGGDTPVVFTGAMRNPSLPSPDGPINLLNSVRTVANDEAYGRGVLVTLNDRVYAAREVTKMHSMNVDSFRSPEFGPLASVEEDRLVWRRVPENPDPTLDPTPDALTNNVVAVSVTADAPIRQVESAADSAALVLATTGAGHIPETLIDPLTELSNAGLPLVATTRCPEGGLARHTYDFPGSEGTLSELCFHFGELNLQKTRIQTIVALAADRLNDMFA
jgi:L-asparaginase